MPRKLLYILSYYIKIQINVLIYDYLILLVIIYIILIREYVQKRGGGVQKIDNPNGRPSDNNSDYQIGMNKKQFGLISIILGKLEINPNCLFVYTNLVSCWYLCPHFLNKYCSIGHRDMAMFPQLSIHLYLLYMLYMLYSCASLYDKYCLAKGNIQIPIYSVSIIILRFDFDDFGIFGYLI